MTHSKGPWRVTDMTDETDEVYVTAVDGKMVVTLADLGPVAANARLIAAAPDMLAALVRLADGVNPRSEGGLTEDEMLTLRSVARDAIAKAK